MAKARYSLYDIAFKNRDTGLPIGEPIIAATGSTFTYSQAIAELKGGRGNMTQFTAAGEITTELTLAFGDVPSNAILKTILGATVTERSAEATGAIVGLANKKGTSVIQATTGIASVSAISGSEADMKESSYVVEVASATTVNVYALTDHDFNRGTAKTYLNSTTRTIAEGLSITTGVDTALTGFGIKLTGGSGTIAMTVGDTAVFKVRPINDSSDTIILGAFGSTPVPFAMECRGLLVTDSGKESYSIIDFYKVSGGNYNGSMTVNEFSATEWTLIPAYDNAKKGFCSIDGMVF